MRTERELSSIKKKVNRLRIAAKSPKADMEADETLDRHETVQNILEAARLDGAPLKGFVQQMLKKTGCGTLAELADKHGYQDTSHLEED